MSWFMLLFPHDISSLVVIDVERLRDVVSATLYSPFFEIA